jgi:uncharacterized membrane protein YhaH (DUF805 family)
MRCIRCGHDFPESNGFCPYCGHPVRKGKKRSRMARWSAAAKAHFLTFSGRMNRKDYLIHTLVLIVIYLSLVFLAGTAFMAAGGNIYSWTFLAVISPIMLLTLMCSLSLVVRRVRDFGGNAPFFVGANLTLPVLTEIFPDPTSTMCAAFSTIIGLYVLFRPGKK